MYEFDAKSGFLLKSDHILRHRQPTLEVSSHFGIRGEFRALLWNANGTLAHDSGWNSNLIVDNAAYLFDDWYSWYTWCCIGSSAAAPATTNTSIGTFLGAQSSSSNPMPYVDYPRPPTAPLWERYGYKKWRFDAGVGTGNVNEFTLGNANDGTNIFCRHVLPATIPKAADQSLDIYYRFYWYPDLTPRTGTVNIKGVSYDWETSFYQLDTYNYSVFAHIGLSSTFASYFKVYDGAKGTPTTDPTGNTANSASKSYLTGGAWYRTERFVAGLTQCNTASGTIKVIANPTYTFHQLQIYIVDTATGTVGFPKDETEEMTVDWKITWARYP